MADIDPLLWISSAAFWSVAVLWRKVRAHEENALRERGIFMLCKGVLPLSANITFEEKHKTWFKGLLPELLSHWSESVPSFDISSVETWPHPANGRAYNTTLKDASKAGLQKLFSSNYEVQSLIHYMIDPSFRLCSFGQQTHWRMYLLMPITDSIKNIINKFVCHFTQQYDILSLEGSKYSIVGEDNAWCLPNWPCEDAKNFRKPWSRNTHIDSGCACEGPYSDGVPISPSTESLLGAQMYGSDEITQKDATTMRLFVMVMKMIAIIFRLDTPSLEPIQAIHGTTGIFPYSHVTLLTALQTFLLTQCTTTNDSPHHPLSFSSFNECIKQFGEKYQSYDEDDELKLTQPSVRFNEVIVAFGLLLHTSMWAIEPILCPSELGTTESPLVPMPRILENAKVHLASKHLQQSPVHIKQCIQLFQKLPQDSLLKQFIGSPMDFLKLYNPSLNQQRSVKSDNTVMKELQSRSDYLAQLFLDEGVKL